MVGIVLVSHSCALAQGAAELARQLAGEGVAIEPVGGAPDGSLGTDADGLRAALMRAERGDGVIVLGDLGSAILTVRHVLERGGNGRVRLVDAPFVEGAVAAAVTASAGLALAEVVSAAEEARGAGKL